MKATLWTAGGRELLLRGGGAAAAAAPSQGLVIRRWEGNAKNLQEGFWGLAPGSRPPPLLHLWVAPCAAAGAGVVLVVVLVAVGGLAAAPAGSGAPARGVAAVAAEGLRGVAASGS
eukprot:CAMPEP_0170173876 /NCGR_PEP_ID=MMETSP0040_2-20121228/7144_1 /TAXON_ID=641309 /ORGANISM="Lotharella oceanica, Strain CCMP622" /LENGTH=115 /DNA_ID=CAMNT_0010415273 /DNA_START=767 /DNA_END=1115 /DNA_ORIENTATION=-